MPDPAARAVLDALVHARGLENWAYFFVTGEGRFFPNGVEESSGDVITPSGQVYTFWTGWDTGQAVVTFRVWREEHPEPHWTRSSEYRRARERVGLERPAARADVAKDSGDGTESISTARGRPGRRTS